MKVGSVKVCKPVNSWITSLLALRLNHLFFAFLLEFDKFLEERAKAADSALPSPPRGEPSAPASAPSSSRKKAERTEDNLFAL